MPQKIKQVLTYQIFSTEKLYVNTRLKTTDLYLKMPTCNSQCQLHHEFEWGHECVIHFERTLERFYDIRFNQLNLLDSNEEINAKIRVVEKEVRKIKRRIRKICQVL